MIIFPAIDLKEGKVVRLARGQFNKMKAYSDDPVTVAQQWEGQGAQWLHVVDLDGAQTGEMRNYDIIGKIVQAVKIPVQMGGGIRTPNDIASLFNAGVKRVILGTTVIQDKLFLKKVLAHWPDKIVVSLDCINGFVAQKGWTSLSPHRDIEFAMDLENLGLQYLIYTNIERDGMLSGPDMIGLQNIILNTINIKIIIAGGIRDINDIKELLKIRSERFHGVITGKAIYEGTLNFKEANALCSRNA